MNRGNCFSQNKAASPVLKAPLLSRLTFWWLRDLFRAGQRNAITEDSLYATVPNLKSVRLQEQFDRLWSDELRKARPSLVRAIFRAVGRPVLVWAIVLTVIETAIRLGQPYFLGLVVSYFSANQTDVSRQEAWLYAAGMIICSLVPAFTFHPYYLFMFEIGTKIRVACSCLIYKKSLKLTKSVAASDGLNGKIINLLSSDVGTIDDIFYSLHDLWKPLLECALITFLVYQVLGYSGLLGMVLILSVIPFQAWNSHRAAAYAQKAAERTDYRVRFMNEIIQGIQVIKMYAWESSFAKLVRKIRRKEIDAIRGEVYVNATIMAFDVLSHVAVFVSLACFSYGGNALTARIVFTTIGYFDTLKESMLFFWPLAITGSIRGYVSAKRVQDFLLTPEGKVRLANGVKKGEEENLLTTGRIVNESSVNKGIVLDGVTAYWTADEEGANVGLASVTTTVEKGTLCVVIGSVGSGKTSLLQVILGELQVDEGSVQVNGTLSYAAQEPWLFDGSIRSNILFVEEYDERRYREVVRICALERDFQLWPHGDQTIVGERGITLSGGQKARVNLARAIYRKSDIYLLDDPLSAVDTHVGKHIYEMCVRDFLADKVCILVTHQLQYLKNVHHVVLMQNGSVQSQGTFQQISKENLNAILTLTPDECSTENKFDQDFQKFTAHSEPVNLERDKQESEKEQQKEGIVDFSVYLTYFRAIDSVAWALGMLAVIVLALGVTSSVNYFISFWVNWEESAALQVITMENANRNATLDVRIDHNHSEERQRYILAYAVLVALYVYLVIQRIFSFYYVCLRISMNLHDRMFRGITRATMQFFKNNPSGRILNRFSRDIGTIDSDLPQTLFDCIMMLFSLSSTVALVMTVSYWFLLPTALVALNMYFARNFYLRTSRVVKRIEATNRSPIYSHTNATLQGLSTIRAFQAQEVLSREFNEHMDVNTSAWHMYNFSTTAFAFWLDMLCVLYITLVTISFFIGDQDVSSGSVGLAITQIISLTNFCQWGVRQTAELENQMISVERVREYADLKSEPESNGSAPRLWPEKGAMKFSKVSLSYSDGGEKVLNNLTFSVRPQEKIGIVGRTGAGKSSLIQAIFRLFPYEGNIEIDGVDTKSLGLTDLRSKISIIPQDPILFSGSLRLNLDPFEERSDEDLWSALEQVELKEAVLAFADRLECKMADGGSNFSMGQRQLVCLARAILRNNKILVLDEATANVDPQTDRLIQTTIRNKFSECTVLTIAHRLHTVMDSDRVLVMDAGRIVEFDHPHKLLSDEAGYLRKLVDQTGASMASSLIRIAEETHKKIK
ncbi:probable multidrug resistance-associated protein lethal(2)03659 [Wyeomyia smithii]|uniref:probable multidrug resistance-associated protein lethal(2)03659 n=1 Tax=Wyeomyia smithii TaxID=174621 RepID=UPI002467B432|nr:probable multidrug resistance-associated protein lethal(2)03659 [Wyeomyia smithii]XP_055536697.1 probable multidrug resistance-associated protein lethal(2)03659 [Wyeomyia smithii]